MNQAPGLRPTSDPALKRWALRAALRLSFKAPSRWPVPASWLRRGMEASAVLFPADPRAYLTSTRVNGVPVDTLHPAIPAGLHIIHLHGGAFFTGSRRTHRALASELCVRAQATVHLPDYRLAPEHPWPAAPDDVMAVWRSLRAQVPAAQIVLSGDSAGCALALGLAQTLRDRGEAGPAALLLISPYLDLSLTAPSIRALRTLDPMVTEHALRRGGDAYRGDIPAADPRVSPLFGGLQELPPSLVQVGSDEILLDDARRFALQAQRAGSTVRLQEWPGAWHDFQLFARALPSASLALDELALWATRHAQAAAPSSTFQRKAV
jgi:epsilon-lactone hydrolase